eukprot:1161958-Pelagomonas_calceolata.AAC.6
MSSTLTCNSSAFCTAIRCRLTNESAGLWYTEASVDICAQTHGEGEWWVVCVHAQQTHGEGVWWVCLHKDLGNDGQR